MKSPRSSIVFSLTFAQGEALNSLALHGRVSRFSNLARNPYLKLEDKGLVNRGEGYDNWSLTQLGALLVAALYASKVRAI